MSCAVPQFDLLKLLFSIPTEKDWAEREFCEQKYLEGCLANGRVHCALHADDFCKLHFAGRVNGA